MTLTFLQGQAIYQMLHILVSITQPIVERGYFSRFIWPSRGGRLFLLNAPSAEHNWALLSAQTRLCLTATHGNREEVRMQVDELRVLSHNCLSQFLFPSSSGFVLLTDLFQWQTQSIILHACSFIHLKLYNDEESSIPLSIHLSPTSPFSI